VIGLLSPLHKAKGTEDETSNQEMVCAGNQDVLLDALAGLR